MRERHARERAGFVPAAPVAVHCPRPCKRVLAVEADEGVQFGVQPVDPRKRRFHQIGGRQRTARDRVRRLAEAERRDLVRVRAGVPRSARGSIRWRTLFAGPCGVQHLLERGGQPVEVVVGARGLHCRMQLAQLDRELPRPLVRERDALALAVQPIDGLAADGHGSLRDAPRAASATLRQNALSHQRRAAPEVDGSTWIAVSPMRCACAP